jgi:hypothetical protein
MIELMSPNANLTVTLRPPDVRTDARTGQRVEERGVKVRFNGGRAQIDEQYMELLEASPAYSGHGKKKRIFLASELMDAKPKGPAIVHGAIGTQSATAPAPRPSAEWDSTGGTALAATIRSGGFDGDPEAAFAYEMANKRRKTVIRALTDAMLNDAPAPEDQEATDFEPVQLPPDTEGI